MDGRSQVKVFLFGVAFSQQRAYYFPTVSSGGRVTTHLYMCSVHAAARRGPKTPPELDDGDSARAPATASSSDMSPPYAEERRAATASSAAATEEEEDTVVVVVVVTADAVTSEKLVAAERPNACDCLLPVSIVVLILQHVVCAMGCACVCPVWRLVVIFL